MLLHAFTQIYCNLWIFDDIYAYVSFQITRYKKQTLEFLQSTCM